jgi:hypothetical protein
VATPAYKPPAPTFVSGMLKCTTSDTTRGGGAFAGSHGTSSAHATLNSSIFASAPLASTSLPPK